MSGNDRSEERNSPPGEDFAGVSECEPGFSRCLNCSLSASCSGVGAAGCGSAPGDLNQPALRSPFCPVNWLLAGESLKNRSRICGVVGHPMRAGLNGLPFVNLPGCREKSRPNEELSL